MSVHDPDCGCDTYGCRLRRKGLQVSPRATPNRRNNVPPRASEPPSINKQIVYDERPGGYKMPIFTETGDPLRHKRWRENRHKIKDGLAKVKAGKA